MGTDGSSNPCSFVVDSGNIQARSCKKCEAADAQASTRATKSQVRAYVLLEIVHPHFSCPNQIMSEYRIDVCARKGRWISLPKNMPDNRARGNFNRASARPNPEGDLNVFATPTSHSIVVSAFDKKAPASNPTCTRLHIESNNIPPVRRTHEPML